LRDLAVALAIALSAAVADAKPFMSIPPDAKIQYVQNNICLLEESYRRGKAIE
jgi:hypothetical protein